MTAEAKARQLLYETGLPPGDSLLATAAAYFRRTRRARRYGLIGGVVVGFGPLAGDTEFRLVVPRMLAGYMLGLLISEWLTPRRERPTRRAADLRTRRAADLLPGWARPAIWVMFVPGLASPLLALARPAPGLIHVRTPNYTCDVISGMAWPGLPVLITSAVIAATGLLFAELTLARLARRPRPADEPGEARLDDIVRGMSARAVAGGATALALILIGQVVTAVSNAARPIFCSPQPGPPVPAWPWAAPFAPWLSWIALATLFTAIAIVEICRFRVDPRHRLVPVTAR